MENIFFGAIFPLERGKWSPTRVPLPQHYTSKHQVFSLCVGVPSCVSLVQGLEWHQEGGLDIAQVEIEYYMGLN